MTARALGGLALTVGALPWLSGDDPARTVLRARSAEREPDAAALESLRAELALPRDPVTGTVGWLSSAAHGDFGRSWVNGEPVVDTVLGALGVSATLAAAACAVGLAGALLILAPGLWRATRTGAPLGGGTTVVGALLASLPEFVLATVLLVTVGVYWGVLPTSGWYGPRHLVLPALALGLPAAGVLSRVLAGAIDATIAETWVRTWRATGFARATLLAAILRRAVAVVLPQLLLHFVGLLAAAVVVESVFAVPGLGTAALRGVLAQDLPLVQGSVALLVLLGMGVGGVGVIAHRMLLGPALRTGGMAPTPSHPAPRRWTPMLIVALLAVVIVLGLTRDPAAVAVAERLEPPSVRHPFGTDALGRDVLARFGHGAVISVGVALGVSALSLAVGVAAGLAGGRSRSGAADVLNALPPVLVGIIVAAVAGPGLSSAALAVCLVAWVPLAVHSRTLAAEVRASGFVQAAVIGGAGRGRLLARHVLPSILPTVARHGLVRVPHNALSLAGLSFLGIGAPHGSPEWGASLAESISYVEIAPWTVLIPAAGLALLGVAVSLARTESDR